MGEKLDAVIKSLNKDFKNKLIIMGEEYEDCDKLPLTSPRLNYILHGGIPIGRLIEIYGDEGGGKALSLDCGILTPTGYKKMRDISVGDSVIDGNGKVTEVIGVYPQGVKPMYRITFNDHTHIDCSDEHLWAVVRHGSHRQFNEVKSTTELLETYKSPKNGYYFYNYSIETPIIEDIDNHSDLPIHPYLLGVLLGDGTLGGNSIGVSLSESDIVNKIRRLVSDWDMELHQNKRTFDYRIVNKQNAFKAVYESGTSLRKELDKMGLRCKSIDKHIPKEYLFTSVENRLLLLQGLYDTDGYTDKRGQSNFDTSSKQLSDDFAFLVRSLGGIDMVTSDVGSYKKNGELIICNTTYHHHLVFRNGIIPCSSEKHLKRYKENRNSWYRKIVNIEPIEPTECQCIRVASESHTFVAENVTVTHNTLIALDAVANFQKSDDGRQAAWIDAEQTFDREWAEKIGVDVDSLILYKPDSTQGAETILETALTLVKTGEIGMLVIDSIGILSSEKELDEDTTLSDKQYGGIAIPLTKFAKQVTPLASRYKCTIIGINQERELINSPYGGKRTVGGKGWKFDVSLRLAVKKDDYFNSKYATVSNSEESPIGHKIKVAMTKSKNGASDRRNGFFTLRYDIGIDYLYDLVDMCIEKLDIIEKNGSWFTIPTVDKPIQGKDKVRQYLADHPDVLKAIEEQMREKIA